MIAEKNGISRFYLNVVGCKVNLRGIKRTKKEDLFYLNVVGCKAWSIAKNGA